LAWLLLRLTIVMDWPQKFSLSLYSLILVGLLVALTFKISYLIRRHEIMQKATVRTLREQASILDMANEPIFIRDAEDRITYWNQGAQRLYGWSKEEVLGHVTQSIFNIQDTQSQSLEDINAQLHATGHWEGELRRIRRDGALVNVASSRTLQRDDSNRALSIIEINYDITERKESEEALQLSEKRFSSAFENAAIGMALVSLDGRWIKVNQALCDSIGYSVEELSSKTFQEITHPDDLEADLANVRQLLDGEISSYKMQKRYFTKKGGWFGFYWAFPCSATNRTSLSISSRKLRILVKLS
jgi:PAS domain S-box-containing protein